MSLLVLHKSDSLSIASDKLVYTNEELGTLKNLLAHADDLSRLREKEAERLANAEQLAKEQGHKAGYDEGYAEGAQAAHVELESGSRALSIERDNLQDTASRLAFDIVRKLTDNLDSSVLLSALALGAAQTFEPEEDLILRVHDSQRQSVQERLGEQCQQPGGVFCRVVGDPEVDMQACIIESQKSRVVADLETQLSLMESHLGLT